MSPLVKHEKENRGLATIVETILETWEWDFVNAGSTTFKKDSESRGFEPDTCFYLNRVDEIRKADHIDIERGDPPPDLVIEIDLTASSLPRNPLFAAVGIPEVWRYAKEELRILTLTDDGYVERIKSVAVPRLRVDQLRQWLTDLDNLKRPQWTKNIRAWAETNRPEANG